MLLFEQNLNRTFDPHSSQDSFQVPVYMAIYFPIAERKPHIGQDMPEKFI